MTGSRTGPAPTAATAALERAHREHWGRLLALLIGVVRSLDVAEDALADSFAAAVDRWPVDGVPDRPEAWLLTVARRRAVDRLRRDATLARKLPLLIIDRAAEATIDGPEGLLDRPVTTIPDERLRLLFTCCHPALAIEARVALTLRCVGGLSTAEVARAFLVSEPTIAARITRAKKKIAAAGVPYRVPADSELPERLDGVLAVLYSVFTEGYAASSGPGPVRADLAGEAIRLTRVVVALMPDEAEAIALLALMLLQHSRRNARVDRAGDLVLLADQNRDRWRHDEIAEAFDLLSGAARGRIGSYLLQATIAAEHARSRHAADTDWARIAELYAVLDGLTGSPVVRLNRAVAVAEVDGPRAALQLLDGLQEPLARHHLFYAARARFACGVGDHAAAVDDYDRALALSGVDADRALLTRRRAACATHRTQPPG